MWQIYFTKNSRSCTKLSMITTFYQAGLFFVHNAKFFGKVQTKIWPTLHACTRKMVACKVVHKNFCNGPKWWFWGKCEKNFAGACVISFNRSEKLVSVSVLLLRSITYLSDAGRIWIVVIVTNTKMHVFGQWTFDKGASSFNKRHLRFSEIL